MANSINGRPWILDTASANPVKTGRTWCLGFVFFDYTAEGDQAIIKDLVRNVEVCKLVGDASLQPVSEVWFKPQQIQSLALTTLGSGKVRVVLK